MTTRYDDALPEFAALVRNALGEDAPLDNFFLRDSAGRLTFVLTEKIDDEKKKVLIKSTAKLKPYIDSLEGAVAYPDELLDPFLTRPDIGVFEHLEHPAYTGFVRLVERRIIGQDWLEEPQDPIKGVPPVVVFASHKGGVGRSTALAVSAIALAERGLDTLIVDLDLEAPGIGDIFLKPEDAPQYGTLDYFVETTFGDVDDSFLEQMIAVSALTQGRGRVHICPAVGVTGDNNPQNVLGKIARAYLEGPGGDDTSASFLYRTRDLIRRLSGRTRYDVIFVDARAGLNEATAAAVLGLGAEILLFGVDTPQTFSGYRYFLSYLQRFRPAESTPDDWRFRLRMVHAKASADLKMQADFRTRTFELFADTLYDEEKGVEETSFNFDYDDSSAPHYAWPILDDSNYSEFKPLQRPDQLSKTMYDRTFGPFTKALLNSIDVGKSNVSENSEL
jgi:hypothetical protein